MLLPIHLHIVYGNDKQADLSGYLKYLLSDPLRKKQYANFCSKIILNNWGNANVGKSPSRNICTSIIFDYLLWEHEACGTLHNLPHN